MNNLLKKVALIWMITSSPFICTSSIAFELPADGQITSGVGDISAINNTMTVSQSSEKMIVEWSKFNLSTDAHLNFVQPSVNSAVLNRVNFTGGLSEINGKINANGQVYIINPNGIIFGNQASVNVNSLIASSLNIHNDIFNNGLLTVKNADAVFQEFNGGTKSFVRVLSGASLKSSAGGRVMLFADRVINEGSIQSPEGQIIMAAGSKIYLESSEDPNLRGLLVEVDGNGSISNLADKSSGGLEVTHGNVTLAGLMVNQNGYVKATTSITSNGSIRLQARNETIVQSNSKGTLSRYATNGGAVVFGENSVTEVALDILDSATSIDQSTLLKSIIDASGSTLRLMRDASIIAHGGDVSLFAGRNPIDPIINPSSLAPKNSSRIYFEEGSSVDVSGVGSEAKGIDNNNKAANVSVSKNIVTAELRGNELRDSPLQRNGVLYTAKVNVDARLNGLNGEAGTSVADVSGYTSQIGRTLAERFAPGGKVSIQSEGDIIFSSGANINVSGGKINYLGGIVPITYLIGTNGQRYDIAKAPKDIAYDSILNVNRYEGGYTSGKDAGSIMFSAPSMILQGSLVGGVEAGNYQRDAISHPMGATLQIGQQTVDLRGNPTPLRLTNVLHSDIVFDDLSMMSEVVKFDEKLTTQKQALILGKNFSAPSGFSSLRYFTDGQIIVKPSSNIVTMAGGNILMDAGGIQIDGDLSSRSGNITLIAKYRNGYIGSLDQVNFSDNATTNVVIGNGVTLNVSGFWVNDSLDYKSTDKVYINGGQIKLSANGLGENKRGDVTIGDHSLLNASGGAWLNSSNFLSGGKGGSIALAASGGYQDAVAHLGAIIMSEGSLISDSLVSGGELSLKSGSVTIGSKPLNNVNGELFLSPSDFRGGGFSAYNISSYEGLTIQDGITINPVARSLKLNNDYSLRPTGSDIRDFAQLELLPASSYPTSRKATNLSLSALGQTSGVLTIGQDSRIILDPFAQLKLNGNRQVTILGSILVPSGDVSINLGRIPSLRDAVFYKDNQTLWLGKQSSIDVSSAINLYNNSSGLITGSIKDGGNINIDALLGELIVEKGAILNLNGTQASINVKSNDGYRLTDIASNGGNLKISVREGMMFDGTIYAKGGNNKMAGGNFSLKMNDKGDPEGNYEISPDPTNPNRYPEGPREIIVSTTGSSVPSDLKINESIDSQWNGKSYIFTDKLSDAGFSSISLFSIDNIRFAQTTTMKTIGSIYLDAPNLYIDAESTVNLISGYVGMGNSQIGNQGFSVKPSVIGGSDEKLYVKADHIDLIGKLNLSGVSFTDFYSTKDIQLKGVLDNNYLQGSLNTAGKINFTASKIYPGTLSNYNINSGDDVSIISTQMDRGVPFSVMGSLHINANNIYQAGNLVAPFGVINLNAKSQLTLLAGSYTSVSASGNILPFGFTVNSNSWLFDLGDTNYSISSLPDKAIKLNGNSVIVESSNSGLQSAIIDVTGGGDFKAFEFTTGTGGSKDVLSGPDIFAILPELKAGYMSGNSASHSNDSLKPGDSIYLSGGNGLDPGNYMLLPARYALLPGGYSVKIVSNTEDFTTQQNSVNLDGSMVISGHRLKYGGLFADVRTSGFLVSSGSLARTQSEFNDSSASVFFKSAYTEAQLIGYQLPADAGRLQISAISNLVLNGKVNTKPFETGQGSEVDISAKKIAISGNTELKTDYLNLTTDAINSLNAESLLIGGVRSIAGTGTKIDVISTDIEVVNSANIFGPEIMLVSSNNLLTESGTYISGLGKAQANYSSLMIGSEILGSGNGAFLRVSSGSERDLIRKGLSSTETSGVINLEGDITLAKSVMIDATFSNTIAGNIGLTSLGSFSVGAPRIIFSDSPDKINGANSLFLSGGTLSKLNNLENLNLKSYSSIDFYGNVTLGNSNLKKIKIESSGIVGYEGGNVSLNSDLVSIYNQDVEKINFQMPVNSGNFVVNAIELVSNAKRFDIEGFEQVTFNSRQFTTKGVGLLNITGNLTINSSRITANSSSNQIIQASEDLITLSTASDFIVLASDPLTKLTEDGGKLTLTANKISHSGNIEMPSGMVTLNSSGNGDSMILKAGSKIATNGREELLGKTTVLVKAGEVRLNSSGNIQIESAQIDQVSGNLKAAAVIDVSSTGGADSGVLIINALGSLDLAGKFNGGSTSENNSPNPKQGSIEISGLNLKGDFNSLNSTLEEGNFAERRDIHFSEGDLILSGVLTAHDLTISTDNGNLTLLGQINAAGPKGGIVRLNAGQGIDETYGNGNIRIAAYSKIDVSSSIVANKSAGSIGDGGKVIISTTSTNNLSTGQESSSITIDSDSSINLSGSGYGSDGNLILRAPRTGIDSILDAGTGVAISAENLQKSIIGAHANIVVEGVKVYEKNTDLTVDWSYISKIKTNNRDFLNSVGSPFNDSRLLVIAGDEIRGAANITVSDSINLQPWGPGALTIRAAGNIAVDGSISAGFTTETIDGTLTSGGQWAYRMVAGAELRSADVMKVNRVGLGNFTLASDAIIRTGTGDIDIASGGDFILGSSTSVIYTAGKPDDKNYSELGSFNDNLYVMNYESAYPIEGGDIRIRSSGNIQGAYSTQLPSNWLFRAGSEYNNSTLWTPYYKYFNQNIGALGGGDVTINSVGDMINLSAVISTNGRLFIKNSDAMPVEKIKTLVVNGGGDLSVSAGGDIYGGLYMVDEGKANIKSDGGLLAGENSIDTIFAIGDGSLKIETLGQLNIATVFNPFMSGIALDNLAGEYIYKSSFFYKSSPSSSVNLTSISGGVAISTNQISTITMFSDLQNGNDSALSLFPANLKVSALKGDISINGGIQIYPSGSGDLNLSSFQSILLNGLLTMSDIDPAIIPSPYNPSSSSSIVSQYMINPYLTGKEYHKEIPNHINDVNPAVLYAGSDIVGSKNQLSLVLSKKSTISATRNIVDVGMILQNLNNSDSSNIFAGNDIYFSPAKDNNGGYISSGNSISLNGPGYLNLTAGKKIILNNSIGLITRGNLDNPYLAERGASINLMVGAEASDDAKMISKYLDNKEDNIYAQDLKKFVLSVLNLENITIEQAWELFQELDTSQKHIFVQSIFFNEIKMAGIEHNDIDSNGYGNYKRGEVAIATMFPAINNDVKGYLDISGSQIKTTRGGDVNIMAPSGSILIGLPKVDKTLLDSKNDAVTLYDDAPANLGVFTILGGNINIFSRNSVEVAQSRIFTIAGGDVLIWSTVGNIDAGKGAKTATASPPPLVRTDSQGNTVVDIAGVVSGSGIGTLQTLKDAPLGNVYLIAPSGTVDAGDAGVRSSGNILVAAQAVANGANMQAGGTSSGVPAPSTANVSFSAPVSADSSNSSKQADKATEAASKSANKSASALPSLITVEVLSLGDETSSTSDPEKDEKKKVKKQQN